jgi:hypothetical protein
MILAETNKYKIIKGHLKGSIIFLPKSAKINLNREDVAYLRGVLADILLEKETVIQPEFSPTKQELLDQFIQ